MNKYIEVVKRAYESGELYLLLAGDNKYIVDSDGKFFLREDIRLAGTSPDECDPMNIEAILSALEEYYCSLDKESGEKEAFWNSLRQSLEDLLSSNDTEKVYFATKIYYSLKKRDEKDSFYPFKGLRNEIRKQGSMIDLRNGRIEIDGVVIEPKFTIKDFEKYDSNKISIFNRGNGSSIIRILGYINSNGINAQIKIEINEKMDFRRVIITPSLDGKNDMKLLDASKAWLKGMTDGSYSESADSISGKYEWGYLSAQCREDRDYEVVGGEIVISYGE